MQPLKIGILGLSGRMGTMINQFIPTQPDLICTGGSTRQTPDHELRELFGKSDILIDFTHPTILHTHLEHASSTKKPLVIGTTGLSAQEEAALYTASTDVPLMYAANTSIGITLLLHLVQEAAAKLDSSFDIEIHETHHRHKKDAPSGTALALGKAAALGRKLDFESAKLLGWNTGCTRTPNRIGFSVQRGGEVIGNHTVSFLGHNESIELGHKAHNRSVFAEGAITAARWLINQKPGLYSMRDVLGLTA